MPDLGPLNGFTLDRSRLSLLTPAPTIRLVDPADLRSVWEMQLTDRAHSRRAMIAPSAYNPRNAMKSSFEETLIEVWRQALVENAKAVALGTERYPVRRTPKRGLRQVDFVFDGNEIRGLEQNPETKSRWAQLARSGKKVMQFLTGGRYVANVVDGKVTFYGKGYGHDE